jgi:hypothetical protein
VKAHSPVGLFDANAWIGAWPFALRPVETAEALRRRLGDAGITAALVSPLAAVLAPEPMPANRALLEQTRPHPALHPAPVINLRVPTWREDLEACAADPRVRAVRLVPVWHDRVVRPRAVAELAREIARRDLRLVVTARLEDERQQHFALRIRGLRVPSVARLLADAAPAPVLVSGLYYREILQLKEHTNLLADVSMAEWVETVRGLLRELPARRLAFGTLSPFLSVPANVAKVAAARVPAAAMRQIASENIRRFLRL